MALLPKTLRFRLFDTLSVKTMRYLEPLPRHMARGLAAEVYAQIAEDFFVNGSLTSRSRVPSLFAAIWTGGRETVQTHAGWAVRRAHILANTERAMGKLPDSSRRVPLDMEVVDEEQADDYRRMRITFAAEPGDRAPAYLLVPNGIERKAPAVLCLHQTTRSQKPFWRIVRPFYIGSVLPPPR